MRKNGVSFVIQLVVSFVILVLLPVIALGVTAATIVSKDAFARLEADLSRMAEATFRSIVNVFENAQSKVTADLILAGYVLESGGQAHLDRTAMLEMQVTNQVTGQIRGIAIPAMKIGSEPVLNNHGIVDTVKNLVGGTATIFQAIPGGILRISMNVLGEQGSRAVGTYIPAENPAISTF